MHALISIYKGSWLLFRLTHDNSNSPYCNAFEFDEDSSTCTYGAYEKDRCLTLWAKDESTFIESGKGFSNWIN